MTEEVAALQVRLEATLAKFEQSMRRGKRTFTSNADQIEKRAQRLDRNLEATGRNFGRGLNSRIQQVGFQVGDFAVQVAGGQSALRAFIQQGTQVAGAFGPAGAVIGALGATVGALGQAYLSTGEASQTFEEATERLNASLRKLSDAQTGLGLSLAELRDLYGENAEAANEFRVAIAQTAITDARNAIKELGVDLDNLFGKLAFPIGAIAGLPGFTPRDIGGAKNSLNELAATLEVTREQALVLGQAFLDAQQAASFDDTIKELENVLSLTKEYNVDLKKLPPETQELLNKVSELVLRTFEADKAAQDLERSIQSGADATGALTAGMASVAEEAQRAAAAIDAAFQAQSQFLKRRNLIKGDDALFALPVEVETAPVTDGQRTAARNFGIRPRRRGGRRSGGTRKTSRPPVDRFAQALDGAQDRLRGLAEERGAIGLTGEALGRYRAGLEAARLERDLLSVAERDGSKATETQREQASQLANEYLILAENVARERSEIEKATEATREQAEASREAERALADMASGFASSIANADSFADALKRVGFQLAELAISGLFNQGPLAGILGGVFGGAAKSGSGAVKAFAKGGVINSPIAFPLGGGTGLAGEAGPEAIIPLKRGSDGSLGVASSGGGGAVYNIDARGAVEGTAQQIQAALENYDRGTRSRRQAQMARGIP